MLREPSRVWRSAKARVASPTSGVSQLRLPCVCEWRIETFAALVREKDGLDGVGATAFGDGLSRLQNIGILIGSLEDD